MQTPAAYSLPSIEFRREREHGWRELEFLLEKIDKSGHRALTADELQRLPLLYRGALSSLSVARAISLDENLLSYLESLTGRAYFAVYTVKRPLLAAVGDFFSHRFPAAVRANGWFVLVAALIMALGTVTSFLIVVGDADRYHTFVSDGYASGRSPETSTEELRAGLYQGDEVADDQLGAFASFLFTHNAKIGMVAFALGFALGVPTIFVLFINGLILGAFAALYHGRGLSLDLWGWLLPHGVTELLAVILCGAAGLRIAQSLAFPGRYKRIENLAINGVQAGTIVLGAVALFLVAGLIEGIFRQRVQDVDVRYIVAAATFAGWALYFLLAGRGPAAARSSREQS